MLGGTTPFDLSPSGQSQNGTDPCGEKQVADWELVANETGEPHGSAYSIPLVDAGQKRHRSMKEVMRIVWGRFSNHHGIALHE